MLQQFNEKNRDIYVYLSDKLVKKSEARVSVFDSVVQGGDAVWEGLRVYNGRVFCLDGHLERLQNSAHAICFKDIPSNEYIKKEILKHGRQPNDGWRPCSPDLD